MGRTPLFTDLHSKKKLSGIYELPVELPECIKYDPKAHEPLERIRKRTIGNDRLQEEIINYKFESNNDEIENGYIWANRAKIEKLTLSGPHRKWIEEILQMEINWDADRLLRFVDLVVARTRYDKV